MATGAGGIRASALRTLLVANRGEIACRVMRTARRMGLRTVAVYSEADAGALHVRMADEAHCVGPPAARESYLQVDRIIAAARAAGADAIHPGYGFLSESAHFAQACAQAGICFVGPPPEAIRAMGSKSAAKALLQKAGVPLTAGYHGVAQDAALLAAEAGRIGFPVLIKASAGGGGKGMRRVDRAQDFADALASCRREALSAFGSDDVLIEKYIVQPRHIEVQVFADTHGNAVYLFERDCSVQRRHQKVLEEAPAPGMTPERRAAMGRAAVQVARAVGYVGAGTVEFIAPRAAPADAPDGGFYFMEMNTRLQVEHPVTEMITGLDLVEWQLRVAAGEPLPLAQEALSLRGHAIEARLYAEDADHGFTPATGTLLSFARPQLSAHVRLDAGVEAGDTIGPHYDPMIAKLIVWDENRDAARARLRTALAQTRIVGVVNNIAFLSRLVDAPSFAAAVLDTDLIERDAAALAPPRDPPPRDAWLLAAMAQLASEGSAHAAAPRGGAWALRDAWRANRAGRRSVSLAWQGEGNAVAHELCVTYPVAASRGHDAAAPTLGLGGQDSQCRWRCQAPESADDIASLRAQVDGRVLQAGVVRQGLHWHVFCGARHDVFTLHGPAAGGAEALDEAPEGAVLAPMPGKVVALLAQAGQHVERDAPLLIVEAMKMEHTVRAPRAGLLHDVRVRVGDQVAMGEHLLDVDEGGGKEPAP